MVSVAVQAEEIVDRAVVTRACADADRPRDEDDGQGGKARSSAAHATAA
jgi:hypothetical protein